MKRTGDNIKLVRKCAEHGIWWKDRFETESGKPELRFVEFFCLDTNQHRKIYQELWSDAISKTPEVFSKQIDPGHPGGVYSDGLLRTIILQYADDDALFDDLRSVNDYIEKRIRILEDSPLL